ncbi:transmembrane protein 80-like [Chaetodon trifascialis]|uniref:transmembrane protein 80-like n=1 Tax=Chaetodon trifascialis TaxID=109706 RepID=UPI0039931329
MTFRKFVRLVKFLSVPLPLGRSAGVLSSVTFQLLLKLTSIYFVFYFLFTLGLIIRKSLVLSYPADHLVCDVGLLFLLAALDVLHFFCGVKGNLSESQGHILANLILTGTTILLTVYFLLWQTYVMRADIIISSVLLVVYSLDGALAFSALARLASVYS